MNEEDLSTDLPSTNSPLQGLADTLLALQDPSTYEGLSQDDLQLLEDLDESLPSPATPDRIEKKKTLRPARKRRRLASGRPKRSTAGKTPRRAPDYVVGEEETKRALAHAGLVDIGNLDQTSGELEPDHEYTPLEDPEEDELDLVLEDFEEEEVDESPESGEEDLIEESGHVPRTRPPEALNVISEKEKAAQPEFLRRLEAWKAQRSTETALLPPFFPNPKQNRTYNSKQPRDFERQPAVFHRPVFRRSNLHVDLAYWIFYNTQYDLVMSLSAANRRYAERYLLPLSLDPTFNSRMQQRRFQQFRDAGGVPLLPTTNSHTQPLVYPIPTRPELQQLPGISLAMPAYLPAMNHSPVPPPENRRGNEE